LVPEFEGYERIIVVETVENWGVVAGLARRYRPEPIALIDCKN
jgi:hypothetical protein